MGGKNVKRLGGAYRTLEEPSLHVLPYLLEAPLPPPPPGWPYSCADHKLLTYLEGDHCGEAGAAASLEQAQQDTDQLLPSSSCKVSPQCLPLAEPHQRAANQGAWERTVLCRVPQPLQYPGEPERTGMERTLNKELA